MPMTPLPLSVPGNMDPKMNQGDIVTIEGIHNRPPVASWAWWLMLAFGPPFAARHFVWAFRRKVSDPFPWIPKNRKGLLVRRRLQTFVIGERYEHTL